MLLFIYLFLKQVLIDSPGWPHTHGPPASVSPVLEVQVCLHMPCLDVVLFFFERNLDHLLNPLAKKIEFYNFSLTITAIAFYFSTFVLVHFAVLSIKPRAFSMQTSIQLLN
jgi:hypothetical protein